MEMKDVRFLTKIHLDGKNLRSLALLSYLHVCTLCNVTYLNKFIYTYIYL